MRLLFIRFSAIGDIVLASPALRCSKQQIPGVEIHFLTKKSMKAVTEANPYVDHFHYFENNLTATIQELKAFSFDYIIDLHKNLRSLRIRKALGVPYLSYNKLSVEKFLLTKFGVNRMPDRHISMRSVDTLAPLGVTYDGKGLDYFVPSGVIEPAFFPAGYVALVIGASYFTKKLPLDSLKVVCSQIPYPIVLVGGKEEKADGDFVLSPAYDLLNTEMHQAEIDFALQGGLYPKSQYQGKILNQFQQLGKLANIPEKMIERLLAQMLTNSEVVERLIRSSFLDESAQKNYYQGYQGRIKRLKYT
jgi:ADP-heptose:LPS heptosyltransferase